MKNFYNLSFDINITNNLDQKFKTTVFVNVPLKNDDESSSAHIAAAKTLLDSSLKFSEFNDILRELEATEGNDDVL